MIENSYGLVVKKLTKKKNVKLIAPKEYKPNKIWRKILNKP